LEWPGRDALGTDRIDRELPSDEQFGRGHVGPDCLELFVEVRISSLSNVVCAARAQIGLSNHVAIEMSPISFPDIRPYDWRLTAQRSKEMPGAIEVSGVAGRSIQFY